MNRGFLKTSVAVGLLLGVGLVVSTIFYGKSASTSKVPESALTFEVIRSDFVSTITESGDVESSSNVEIRCRVRERGGTAILKIVDEGTMVKPGDFLVQLDDAGLRDELIEEKIRVATDRASVIQAESNLEAARRALAEFENGVFSQELQTLQAEHAFAQENLRRAEQYQTYSENLARKGYVTKAQLEADRFAVVKAKKELELSKSKLALYEEFTRDRMVSELKAEINKEEANLEAAQFTLDLSKQRLKYYEDQVEACCILAPTDGQVVYANEIDGRGDSGIVIEEGVTVRESQPIIRLPDPSKMQVTAKVNDSKINAVRAGQTAIIRLDTAPETPIKGVVRKVAAFPEPRRWSQAPIEYKVFVDVLEQTDMVRPGLRAKVEMFVEQLADAVQVPVSALIKQNQSHFVVVQSGDKLELRSVDIGPNNQSTVVIHRGVEPGEKVLVDPDRFRDQLGDTAQSDGDT